jgi:hypothetical protein
VSRYNYQGQKISGHNTALVEKMDAKFRHWQSQMAALGADESISTSSRAHSSGGNIAAVFHPVHRMSIIHEGHLFKTSLYSLCGSYSRQDDSCHKIIWIAGFASPIYFMRWLVDVFCLYLNT